MGEENNNNNNGAPDWKAALPEEIKAHPSMQNFKDVGDLARSWVGAQALIGVEKVPVPKDANDPNLKLILSRLGHPEKPDGYKLPELKDLPQGFQVEAERVKAFSEVAHKTGLTNTQVAELYQWYVGQQAGMFTQTSQQLAEAKVSGEKALRAEWGTAYEAQVDLADKVLVKFAGEKAEELGKKFGNDPTFIRMMASIGNQMSEDILGVGSPKPGDMTPQAAQEEIKKILGDIKSPYYIQDHAEHQAMVDKVAGLYKIVHPGTESD